MVTLTAHARVVAAADGTFPVLASQVPLVLRRTPDAVYLVGGAAGPLGGDDLSLSVQVAEGACVRLRTAAASVALPGQSGAESVFRVRATVGAGGRLEYLPEPLVVANGARHTVRFDITLAEGAMLILRDEVILGRHDERGGTCTTQLRVDYADAPLLRHEVTVSGTDEVSLGPAMLAGCRAFGSLLSAGPGSCPLGSALASPASPASPADGVAMLRLAGPGILVTALALDALTLRRLLELGAARL
jgi:urease accessory protein